MMIMNAKKRMKEKTIQNETRDKKNPVEPIN